ncbi:MAG: META domain-containing protein [bacterium]
MEKLALCSVTIWALGCATSKDQPQKAQALLENAAFAITTATTFSGVLPCADCEGIRYMLNLQPGNVFYLRQTYLGKGADDSFYDLGAWSLADNGRKLTLKGGREAPLMFTVESAEVLKKLDLEGGEIQSQLDYKLQRAGQFEWFDVPAVMRGMYSYMADAGMLAECSTGKRFPVALAGDNAAVEAAYAKARQRPGEAVLVSFEGRITRRPKMEGEGEQEVIVVDRFNAFRPGETCGEQQTEPALEQTYWKLVDLEGKPAIASEGTREAHLQLSPGEKRAAGSSGCNRITGAYELSSGSLRFSKMAGTRMMCPGELMQQETAFTKALEATAGWKIADDGMLALLNAEGAVLARFEPKSTP